MRNRITIVSVSKSATSSPLIKQSKFSDNFRFRYIINNTNEGLASIYNRHLRLNSDELAERDEGIFNHWVVFVHDDVLIFDGLLEEKLADAFQQYDVIGLAGATKGITLPHKVPALWNTMAPRANFSGLVFHYEKNFKNPLTDYFPTVYGPLNSPATLVDGLFLAVNQDVATKAGLLFDENCPAKFHYYDLIFCIRAKLLNLRVGTYPIFVAHKSHGLEVTSDEFLDGEKYFRNYFKQIATGEKHE